MTLEIKEKTMVAASPALYADILSVDVPAEANAGDEVVVKVNIKNLYTAVISIKVTGVVLVGGIGWGVVTFPTSGANINPGQTYQFEGYFTMPNENIVLSIVSFWYGGDGQWHSDDVMVKEIKLAGAPLAEFSRVRYWDASTGQYVSEPPTILIGSEAGADFIVENVSGGYLDIGLFVQAFDPFGNSLGAKMVGPTPLAPGGSLGGWYKITTEFPGTYTFTVDIITSPLIPYGIIGTLGNIPIAYVVGEIPPLAGHVYDPLVVDSTTGETFYSADLPVGIIGGHKVIVGIHWMNDGGETATFTPAFELIDPDGTSREAQTFTTVLSPSEGTGGQTGRSVELDKAGMWKIHAILEADGTLLDEEIWNAISVTVLPPPEYGGTISKKQLTYDSTVGIIPVTAKVSQGTRGIVTVLGRNDMDTTQQMGIIWSVKDPEGYEVEHYSAWEAWPYNPPGGEHKFDGGRFDIDKPGVWTIEIALYMNHDDPVIVDSYTGTLCQVEVIEYAGTISKKQFKYDSVIGNIPVAKVSQGMDGVVTAWGRNDMAVQQQLGMRWEVRDPDGYVMEQYPGGGAINWEYGYTGPGDTQDFIGGRFDLNKLGGWTIYIELFMNPDSPVVVADYYGLLCTVEALEYIGSITGKFINKSPEGFRIPIPTEVAADNNTFEVGVKYKNLSGRTVPYCGCKVEVRDPDGILRASPAVDWTGLNNNQELETQYNICAVDKEGDWTVHIDFLMDSTEVVDTYDGLLFTAVEEVLPPEYTLVQHTIYSYAYVYDGQVEVTTADFRISPFTSSAWAANQFAAELESEVKKAGARVVEVKAYADVTPFLWTDIRIEVTATPITTTSSKATGIAWAALVPIIIKALAIIAVIIAITLAVKAISRYFQSKPINEEIKLAMTKETLISLAVDLENKLEFIPTPVDVLEGKTKGELIVYCDELAEEIVPPGIEIPWAWIIGGVAVVGVAAVALASRRK